MNISVIVCRIIIVLFWIWIVGKTTKTPENSMCLLWQKSSISRFNQMKREHVTIKVWHFKCFGCRDFPDKLSDFARLQFFLLAFAYISWVNPLIRNNAESTVSWKNHLHYCRCWWENLAQSLLTKFVFPLTL